MLETDNNMLSNKRQRLVLRIGKKSLAFAVADSEAEKQIFYEPYTVKSGISMAANLREAFRESSLLGRGYQRALVLVDGPVLLVPVEEFSDDNCEVLYHHAVSGHAGETVLSYVLPTQNVVAVFAINKDLKLVVDDHYADVKYCPVCVPVWNYLHHRSFTGNRRKLYGYFHDRQLNVLAFDKNRFRFCNSFDTDRYKDAVYFLLYVWKQLGMDERRDELHLLGDIPEQQELMAEVRQFVQYAHVINPSADFNRAPITQIKGLPCDVMAYFLKGR
ncbi:MAG: DUF3822 family protein [Prevotella sp.]|nr:DUF3822 family protein [Prevotella sp.]